MSATTKSTCCCASPENSSAQPGAAPLTGAGTRTKCRTEAERTRLIHRLNRIEGQIRGLRGMVEKNAYCPDILVQTAAANAALNAFSRELLDAHVRTCVAQDIRNGRDETIDELLAILQKLMK